MFNSDDPGEAGMQEVQTQRPSPEDTVCTDRSEKINTKSPPVMVSWQREVQQFGVTLYDEEVCFVNLNRTESFIQSLETVL